MEIMETQSNSHNQGMLVECNYCHNSGKVYEANHVGILDIGTRAKVCPACHGTGYHRV
jgi:DnaJ-class molecular chaperone